MHYHLFSIFAAILDAIFIFFSKYSRVTICHQSDSLIICLRVRSYSLNPKANSGNPVHKKTVFNTLAARAQGKLSIKDTIYDHSLYAYHLIMYHSQFLTVLQWQIGKCDILKVYIHCLQTLLLVMYTKTQYFVDLAAILDAIFNFYDSVLHLFQCLIDQTF